MRSSSSMRAHRRWDVRSPCHERSCCPTLLQCSPTSSPQNRSQIIAGARARVGSRICPQPTAEELEHGIPVFLEQVVARKGGDVILRAPATNDRVLLEGQDECGGPSAGKGSLPRPLSAKRSNGSWRGLAPARARKLQQAPSACVVWQPRSLRP